MGSVVYTRYACPGGNSGSGSELIFHSSHIIHRYAHETMVSTDTTSHTATSHTKNEATITTATDTASHTGSKTT